MLFPLHAVCLPDVEWQPWSVCHGVCGHSLDAVCFPDAADVEWWSCLVCHNICLHSLDAVCFPDAADAEWWQSGAQCVQRWGGCDGCAQ